MKIDIEKLNRKTPYPEPSDEFFKMLQDNVISKTIGENIPAVQKEAKVFSLNFKWVAAAAVVLIAGLTAFFGLNENPEVQIAQQKPIIDSSFETEYNAEVKNPAADYVQENKGSKISHSDIEKTKHSDGQAIASSPQKTTDNSRSSVNIDRQDYAVDTKRKPESEVEKVLAAFTPDQIKDIDRNSEQDVYLDLYN